VGFEVEKNRKLDENNSVWGAEASKILGISKPTFNKRLLMGRYKVNCMRCPMGFKYSIFDVFEIGFFCISPENNHFKNHTIRAYTVNVMNNRNYSVCPINVYKAFTAIESEVD